MGKIVIAESEQNICIDLNNIIKSIDDTQEVFMTGYAEKVLEYAADKKTDAFFLDIQLKDYSGLKLAELLREMECYKFTPIVFITDACNMALEAFMKVHCYDYIIKPFAINEAKEIFETIINYGIKKATEKRVLKIKQKNYTHLIYTEDIIYIESQDRKLTIKTNNKKGIYSTYTLNQIIGELPEHFIRCHKSYVVNKNHIKEIDRRRRIINFKLTEESVPYGRKYKDNLFIDYCLPGD